MDCYSTNNEDWSTDVESVYEYFANEVEVGEKVEYWIGEGKQQTHESFVDAMDIIERMREQACNEYDDFAEAYLDELSGENVKQLEALLLNFFNEHAKQPTFFMVVKAEKIEGWWNGEEIVSKPMMTAQKAKNVLS